MKIYKGTPAVLYKYAEHLKNLSPDDQYTRFGYQIRPESIDKLILNILYHPEDHYLFVAEIDATVVGFGHLAKFGNDWELAVSVDGEYQGRHIGDSLIGEMIEWGKLHGITSLFMHCINENTRIQHLARKHGLKTFERSGSDLTAQVALPDPTLIDYARNYITEQASLISQMSEIQKKLLSTLVPGAMFKNNDLVD